MRTEPHTHADRPNAPAIGRDVSARLQEAFDYFNAELFGDTLPPCAVIVHRHRGAYGYFWADRWQHRDGGISHEIALHPDHIISRPLAEALATLVHEMCHLQQQVFGKPSRTGYHNKEWARMMDAVGLTPSDTAAPGGKRTGQKVSHYIEPGGPFGGACERLLLGGFTFDWGTLPAPPATKGKSGQRVKYECPECSAAAWGKAGLEIKCKPCDVTMEGEETEGEDDGE